MTMKTVVFILLVTVLACTQAMKNDNNGLCKDGRDGRDGKDGKDGIGLNGKDGKDGRDGRNGINGKDGKDGKQGLNGKPGKDGLNGKNGKDGLNGKPGEDGKNGIDGRDGSNGAPGKDGLNGKDGKDGIDGKDGNNGNEPSKKNWKECAWNHINDGKDSGEIKHCLFKKNSIKSYLKVVASSNMRIVNCNSCCKRWFVTFDGHECASVPIDGVVYMDLGTGSRQKNLHRPRVVRGHCKISKNHQVKVALNVGNCHGYGNADAYTGWNSATRIYIEEVDEPQS
ncbi:collagen triple helix repeat-containing protein 1-like [Clytia hemisphaerica]|uniref:CTHRC1 C-terminal domain-containing protein n=1 Tax=Clytia hemisphaerica TaxID=252671 RepID=A0A7M5U4Z2_9CNID|eukprot:TCONS_00053701-protein